MREHQKPKKATIGPCKAVNNVMPMEFATLLQEGGPHEGAPQRQVVRTAISPSKLARAINRIFPQAYDIVIPGISDELGYPFTPTEEEIQMLANFLSEWFREKISARQRAAVATTDSVGDVDSTHSMGEKA